MSALPWILIGVTAALIVSLGLVFIVIRKRKGAAGQEPDYRSFFLMGLSWLCMGLPFMFFYGFEFNALFIMGIIFTIMGAANYRKWKKRPLTKNQKIGWVLAYTAIIIVLAFVWMVKLIYG